MNAIQYCLEIIIKKMGEKIHSKIVLNYHGKRLQNIKWLNFILICSGAINTLSSRIK